MSTDFSVTYHGNVVSFTCNTERAKEFLEVYSGITPKSAVVNPVYAQDLLGGIGASGLSVHLA